MKKLLFSLSLLASLATFAGESTVEATAQVFGVLPITSSATNVIVAVPWVAASNTETNLISVTDIIKTANLTAGDWIRVWSGGTTNDKFKVWNLVSQGGVLVWEAGTTVTSKGAESSGSSSDTYLKRGEAIILHRKNPGTGSGNTFYVYGQYNSNLATPTTCVKGDATTPAYTLIAPPNTTAVDINDGITWSGGKTNDKILFSDGVMATYDENNDKWVDKVWDKTKKSWGNVELEKDIPAGTGIWYISNGGQAVATWQN